MMFETIGLYEPWDTNPGESPKMKATISETKTGRLACTVCVEGGEWTTPVSLKKGKLVCGRLNMRNANKGLNTPPNVCGQASHRGVEGLYPCPRPRIEDVLEKGREEAEKDQS